MKKTRATDRSTTPGEEFRQAPLPGAMGFGYAPLSGRWDEMVTTNGSLRPHWERFVRTFSDISDADLEARWATSLRLLRENGVTYNVYGDPRGLDRPWQLDPVPMLISAEEWRGIETAMVQRATLLNMVLADIYGHQQLLTAGVLPPALVHAHPGYLRPLRHVLPPQGVFLHLYAADLARSPDGRWWVMSDRTEAPSGAGYALENRIIVSRALPEGLRAQPVEALTPFFHKLRDNLVALSPRDRDQPRIVLLTPGPYNETYFEHAYLARQLGCTLVEGEDLTMRDNHVFLKTLDGLQPVDVILRRTDGGFCDPLELRGDSTLGVAGLVQAVRAGTVTVANALGSGLVEGGSLAPYLPSLARHLLGEELKLPTVATWWCGTEAEERLAIANLENFVIKPSWPGAGPPVFGDRLSAKARQELEDAIHARPHDYLVQERVRLSSAPVWDQGELDPRPLMVRVFLSAHDGGYTMMAGGLTRIAAERSGSLVSMQEGGGSKDTWVLAESQQKAAPQLRSAPAPVRLARGSQDLSSRVADNLFWLGRYIERTEDTTRLLRAALVRSGSAAGFGSTEELPVVLRLLAMQDRRPSKKTDDDEVLAVAATHFGGTTGLRHTVEMVHRSAALARDRLSLDTWRAVTRLHHEVGRIHPGPPLAIEETLACLNDVVLASEALSGLAMENMTRGLSWRFIDIGRRLERAVHVLDLVSGIVVQEDGTSDSALAVILEILDSVMTYRSRYFSTPQLAPVLDLLLADESNPRSLVFQINALDAHVAELGVVRRATFLGLDQRLTIWLSGAVRTAEIEILARPDEDGGRRALGTFLEVLRSKLWELSETVTREYFTHAVGRRNQNPGSGRPEFLP